MKRFLRAGLSGLLVACATFGCDSGTSNREAAAPQLIFSTYIGGSQPCDGCADTSTFALNSASDSEGNTYVTGATQVKDLPVKGAMQTQPAAGSSKSAFVVKYDTTGKILWGTYLGGDNETIGVGIAAMPGGGVAVAGLTSSDSAGPFPTKNAYQDGNSGQSDYFVAVFDSGGTLRYSTYLGGSEVEGETGAVFADNASNGNDLAVDANGLVYVTGTTASANTAAIPFPLTPNAVQPQFGGVTDAFLAIIDPSKTGAASLIYSSFIGGKNVENGHAITVNESGSAITVVGYTNSSDFPTTANGLRSTPPPSGFTSNGYVAQISASVPGARSSQYATTYSSYLGANSNKARDDAYAVTHDQAGLIVITGRTQSADFPMLDSLHASLYNSAPYLDPGAANDEPYLVKLNTALDGAGSLVYSTFLGGGSISGGAFCTGAAVDQDGASYVVGETSAQGAPYQYTSMPVVAPMQTPYTTDALFTANQGSPDVLLMQVSADGSTLSYSTFVGGPDNDRGYGVAIDPSGNVILSGLTYSSDFPAKDAAQNWPGNAGKMNGFVTKFGR